MHDHISDNDLVAAVLRGETQAFAGIVRRYERPIAATITGMLGRTEEVEEIGQQVFIRFYEALPNFRGDASVKTYLTRIAINLSLNELKRRKRRFSLFRSVDDALELPSEADDHAESSADRELIEQALKRIPAGMREVVVLRLVNGYSTEETATMLNIPEGTVLSRLSLARKQLQTLLKPFFGEEYAK
ncbi:MAG: sigma-70 family RNA polymerase sigma factor [Candidatus Kapabacteria bacterium]|nr:sigma-70 family RNA polymerase sigma factor [Candidatus Kapabacteria bacterium]